MEITIDSLKAVKINAIERLDTTLKEKQLKKQNDLKEIDKIKEINEL